MITAKIKGPPHFTVEVKRGTEVLEFSPRDAYGLLAALHPLQGELYHYSHNFYECNECGGLHLNGLSHKEATETEESEAK